MDPLKNHPPAEFVAGQRRKSGNHEGEVKPAPRDLGLATTTTSSEHPADVTKDKELVQQELLREHHLLEITQKAEREALKEAQKKARQDYQPQVEKHHDSSNVRKDSSLAFTQPRKNNF